MRQLAALTLGALLSTVSAGPAAANDVIVNRDTGRIVWRNSTGRILDVAAYTLQSKSGGFEPATWLSITENYDADSGGILDMDDTWFLLGRDPFNLSEATLGTTSISAGGIVDLGTAWIPHHVEDVTFEYLDVVLDEVLPGSVQFISAVSGDYNANGVVEQADLDLVIINWGKPAVPVPHGWINDLPLGRIDQAELDSVLLNWGAGGQVSVQPSLAGLFAASVPEPPAVGIALSLAIAGCSILTRRAGAALGTSRRTTPAAPPSYGMRQCSKTASAAAT